MYVKFFIIEMHDDFFPRVKTVRKALDQFRRTYVSRA